MTKSEIKGLTTLLVITIVCISSYFAKDIVIIKEKYTTPIEIVISQHYQACMKNKKAFSSYCLDKSIHNAKNNVDLPK